MASSVASKSAISALIQSLQSGSAWYPHLARQSAKVYLGTEYAVYEMPPDVQSLGGFVNVDGVGDDSF